MLRRLLAACSLLSCLLLPPAARAASMRVTSIPQLEAAIGQAGPGDTITLADGTYSSGPIEVARQGGADQPITIASESIGGAVITGGSFRLSPSAAHVVIRGFRFNGAMLVMDLGSHHIHVTRNHFEVGGASHAVFVQGNDQELSYNNFQNKTASGAMVRMDAPSRPHDGTQRTFIHHNLFLNHGFTGGNGGECIATWGQVTRVEHNLFEQCNGDPEIISVKASDGFYRFNTFRGSTRGQFVLRYARNVVVEGNYLLGTRGMRLYGPDMKITNNYTEGGTVSISHGATGYLQIERMLIAHNTFVNTAITGRAGTLPPQQVTFAYNLVHKDSGAALTEGDGWVGTRYLGNIVSGGASLGDIPAAGGRVADAQMIRDASGVLRPAAGSPVVNAATGSSGIGDDIDGQPRLDVPEVGADELSSAPAIRKPLTRTDVGPNAVAAPVTPPPDAGVPPDANGGDGGMTTGGAGGSSPPVGGAGGIASDGPFRDGGGAGSSGTGGVGGSSTGGASGSTGAAGAQAGRGGGAGGRGGSAAGAPPAAGPGSGGCGCHLGAAGSPSGGAALTLLAVGLVALRAGRRRR